MHLCDASTDCPPKDKILHGPAKAPSHPLILNNVLKGGIFRSGKYSQLWPVVPNGSVKATDNVSGTQEDWPEDSHPMLVSPGCTRRLLTPFLQSRCQNLRYLCLCKQGQQHPD